METYLQKKVGRDMVCGARDPPRQTNLYNTNIVGRMFCILAFKSTVVHVTLFKI
jgi:hypothetical protein